MKRAAILHGTSSSPNSNWQPWFKTQLETAGYDVFSPVLPENNRPNRQIYEKFLQESGWDFSDNILIGHSSGATTVLNLLLAGWFPKVKAVVLVGTFLNQKLTKDLEEFTDGLFDDLFLDKYDPKELKKKAQAFYFVHGDNDPYCDIDDARKLCQGVSGTFITIPGGHHLGGVSGVAELPQALQALRQDHIL